MELLPFKEARYVLKHYGLQHQKAKAIEENHSDLESVKDVKNWTFIICV